MSWNDLSSHIFDNVYLLNTIQVLNAQLTSCAAPERYGHEYNNPDFCIPQSANVPLFAYVLTYTRGVLQQSSTKLPVTKGPLSIYIHQIRAHMSERYRFTGSAKSMPLRHLCQHSEVQQNTALYQMYRPIEGHGPCGNNIFTLT